MFPTLGQGVILGKVQAHLGDAYTRKLCARLHKPHQEISARKSNAEHARTRFRKFCAQILLAESAFSFEKKRYEKLVGEIAQRVSERGTASTNFELILSIVIATFTRCESNRIAAAAC